MTLVAIATMAACALPVPGAQAITNGTADEGRHPWVGGLVSYDPETGEKYLICSGVLIDRDVFLTAAHCFEDEPSDLYVSFDDFIGAPDVGPEVKLHHGQAHGDPDFEGNTTGPGDTHDLGVVVLDRPVKRVKRARLPRIGALDKLSDYAHKIRWKVVGYGREGHDGEGFFGGGSRHYGFGSWLSLDDYTFKLSQLATDGEAGTCNGDSGGPVFIGNTRTLAGISVDGDTYCQEDSINVRLDTRSAHGFLDRFLESREDD
jgi:V8-like Glu-specific endopeptidase